MVKRNKVITVLLLVLLLLTTSGPMEKNVSGNSFEGQQRIVTLEGIPENGYIKIPTSAEFTKLSILESTTYQKLEQKVISASSSLLDNIDISDLTLTTSEAMELYFTVLKNNPQLFYLKFRVSAMEMNGKTQKIYLYYNYSKADIPNMVATYKNKVNQFTSGVDPSWSDYQKAAYVYGRIATTTKYDEQVSNAGPDSFNAYGVFVQNKAVCQGYALAFLQIMKKELGIETHYISSDEMNHAWNLLKLDGVYYHVDTTWADPIPDRPGLVNYSYFLKSDSEMGLTHYGWNAPFKATGTRFDKSVLRQAVSSLLPVGQKTLYIDHSGNLCFYDFTTNTAVTKTLISERWKVLGSSSYWVGTFSSLLKIGNKLYFNDSNDIFSMDLQGNNIKKIHTINTTNGYIYGMTEDNGVVTYYIKKSPNESLYTTGTMKIDIEIPVETIAFKEPQMYLATGESSKLEYTITPSSATNKAVVFSSSDTQTVSVTSDGTIKALKEGIVEIMAKTLDGGYISKILVGVYDKKILLNEISGSNRYTTAVTLSKESYTTTDTAILVSGLSFPDALSAGPLASYLNAPILLSQPTRISDSTLNEIIRLQVKEVVILGGTSAVGLEVEQQLMMAGITNIKRIKGSNRYETSALVAQFMLGKGAEIEEFIVTSGQNFADALSIGSVAAKSKSPILLTRSTDLPRDIDALLQTMKGKNIRIIGGEGAVSAAVENQIKTRHNVERIKGKNRYDTAIQVAQRFYPNASRGLITSGMDYVDALAATPYAAKNSMPVFLVKTDSVSASVATYVETSEVLELTVVGGAAAIEEPVRKNLEYLINLKQ